MCNKKFDHVMYGLKPKHRFSEAHATLNDDLPNRIQTGRWSIDNQFDWLTGEINRSIDQSFWLIVDLLIDRSIIDQLIDCWSIDRSINNRSIDWLLIYWSIHQLTAFSECLINNLNDRSIDQFRHALHKAKYCQIFGR